MPSRTSLGRQRCLAAVLVIALVSSPLPSAADATPSPTEKAMAIQLFKDGKELLNLKKFSEACPKLEASAKLDPTADGTILNLGLCYEGLGRYATAFTYFTDSIVRAKKSGRTDREALARERIAVVEGKLSKITVRIAESAKVSGLQISWDGKPLDPALWGSAFPVDPGAHQITATAAGYRSWQTTVTIDSVADRQTIDVPRLTTDALKPVSPTSVVPVKSTITSPPTDKEEPAQSHTASWIAFGTAGVFVIGAVGGFVLAKSAQGDRRDFCAGLDTPSPCRDDESLSRMHRWETISYVAGGAAIVGATIGILLWSSSSDRKAKAEVTGGATSTDAAGVRFKMRF